jgi:Tol biopolymer transport system component
VALDERLRRELERAGRPADPTGVYEHLIRRRERRRIARRVELAGLAVLVIAGSALGFLTLARVFGTQQRPAAGPSNGRIAFTNFDSDLAIADVTGGWFVYTMEPDGSDVELIAPREVDEALSPTFSPDGRRIAFAGFTAEPEERALYVLDLDSGSLSKILVLDRQQQIEGLEWSPEGGRIGILRTDFVWAEPPPEFGARDFDTSSTIWTIVPDGSDLRQVTTVGREREFSWSPDGSQIMFTRHEPIEPGDREVANDLYVVNADGTGERRLTTDGVSMSPAWSPDGGLVAFESFGTDSGIDLYLMNADGTDRRRLTSDPGNEHGAVWSPDGARIAFSEQAIMDDNTVNCYVATMDVNGADRVRLIGMPDEEGCPGPASWAPALAAPIPSESSSPNGSPTEVPTPDESPDRRGEDVGLGFPVCDVTSVSGTFAPGVSGTAYVATKRGDLDCPDTGSGGAFQVLAVDVTGDGVADVDYGPLECDPFCTAFAAPDVDGDGTDELLIQNIQFSIAGLRLYDVSADPPRLVPVTVSSPGYPEGGLAPGAEPQFWLGGDGFNLDELQCGTFGGARALVQTSATATPGDTPDSVWQAVTTTFRLEGDTVAIVDAGSFEEPVDQGGPSFWTPDDGICGAGGPAGYGGG